MSMLTYARRSLPARPVPSFSCPSTLQISLQIPANLLPPRSVSPSVLILHSDWGYRRPPHCQGRGYRQPRRRRSPRRPHARKEREHFECKHDSQPRHDFRLFDDAAHNAHLKFIKAKIRDGGIRAQYNESRIETVEGNGHPGANKKCQNVQAVLDKTKGALKALNTFTRALTYWAASSRVLGYVILSPPIGISSGSKGFTEDQAVIKVDASKVDGREQFQQQYLLA